jgi:hypothetical protein
MLRQHMRLHHTAEDGRNPDIFRRSTGTAGMTPKQIIQLPCHWRGHCRSIFERFAFKVV